MLEMPTLQSSLAAETGVRELGAEVCRLFGPELIKCMLTIAYLIFRSMS